jgi:hypothetical protein
MRFFRWLLISVFRLAALALIVGVAALLGYEAYKLCGVIGAVGAGAAVISLTLLRGLTEIPTASIGVVIFLNIRTERVLREGYRFVIPFFESVELFDFRIQTTAVEPALYYCQDGLAVILGGELSWQIEPALASSTFFLNQRKVESELMRAIRSEFGIIAGVNKALDFKGAWESATTMMNAILQMGTPPHIAKGILPVERLVFYADADGKIRGRLQIARRRAEERSEIENRCGIHAIWFTLTIGYTDETGKGMQAEGLAVLRANAGAVTSERKAKLVAEKRARGLKPLEAEIAAEVDMGLTERKVHTLEGLKDLRPFSPPESINYGGPVCLKN